MSRNGSYYKSKLKPKDIILKEQILNIRLNHPFYGLGRLQIAFKSDYQNSNQNVSINRLRRVCKLHNLKPKSYSKAWNKTKDVNLPDTKIPNLLKPLMEVKQVAEETGVTANQCKSKQIKRPNQVWCSDFTYLKFQGMWYYLATVIDTFTKEIVGFHISRNHNSALVIRAMRKAINKYGCPEISHNDQGSEYRSMEYLELLKVNTIIPSNSAKSSPWENSYQESFYGKFKAELELSKLYYDSNFMELYNYISNQIEYYNNYRIHSSIVGIPNQFRLNYYAQINHNLKVNTPVHEEENLLYDKSGG